MTVTIATHDILEALRWHRDQADVCGEAGIYQDAVEAIRHVEAMHDQLCPREECTRRDLDNCPACGRRISDLDPDGCELESGQRYCLAHAPADSEVGSAYRKFLDQNESAQR